MKKDIIIFWTLGCDDMSENQNKRKKAIALRYDKKDSPPRVIAKGQGYVADSIIEKGLSEDIQIYEDEVLASQLLNLDIGEEIPEELYFAVAEVLAFIFEIDKEKGEKLEFE